MRCFPDAPDALLLSKMEKSSFSDILILASAFKIRRRLLSNLRCYGDEEKEAAYLLKLQLASIQSAVLDLENILGEIRRVADPYPA